VTAKGLAVLVDWAPNAATDQVTSYTATASLASGYAGKVKASCATPPTTQAPGTSSSALVANLCSGVPYVITLTATNAAGTSGPSNSSNVVAPLSAQAPSPPLIVSVVPRNKSLVVSWSPPFIGGGDPLKGYVLTATGGPTPVTANARSKATEVTLKKLTDGTPYALRLVATSKAGSSVASTSTGTPAPVYVPGVPSSLQVNPDGSGNLVATWGAPVDNGGAKVSHYVVTTQRETPDGSGGWTATGSPVATTPNARTTTLTLSGLTTDAFYDVSVAAKNSAGTGAAATTSTPITPATGITANTVVLTSSTMAALASNTGGVLTWPAPAPSQVQSLVAGNVIVSSIAPEAPQGLLLKVSNVSSDGSGNYTVTTSPASLTDAFTDLGVSESGNPLAAPGAAFRALVPGVRQLRTAGPGLSFSNDVTLSFDLKSGSAELSGSVDVNPEVDISMEVNQDLVGFPDSVNISASATVTASAQVTEVVSGSGEWKIGEIDGDPIDVQVGPVPLILVPKLPVYLDAAGNITVGASASMTVGASMSWSSDNPNTVTTNNLSTPIKVTGGPLPGVTATAQGSVDLVAKPQIDIYDVTGPEIDVDANLTAKVNFTGTPFVEIDSSIAITADLAINLQVGPYSYNQSFEIPLLTLNFAPYIITSPPNATLLISPTSPHVAIGLPAPFTATRSDGASDPITWLLQGEVEGDSISNTGVLTTVAPSNRTLTVIAQDSTGAVGETTVSVGPAFDSPANLTTELSPDGTDLSVSWQAPTNTGGFPLSSYTIVTTPATTTQIVPGSATGAQINGLTKGVTYVISVFAMNTGGLTSLPITAQVIAIPFGQLGIPMEAPLPPNVDQTSPRVYMPSVTCWAAGSCVAVGEYFDDSGNTEGFIETLSDGAWSTSEAPLPSGSNQGGLLSVACPAPGDCVAVGWYQVPNNTVGLIDTLSNGTWTALPAPVPSGDLGTNLVQISCASVTFCGAIATADVDPTDLGGYFEVLSGGVWTSYVPPVPSGLNPVGCPTQIGEVCLVSPRSLACPANGFCIAASGLIDPGIGAVIETFSNGSWNAVNAPLPPNGRVDTYGMSDALLGATACPTSSQCQLVGEYEDLDGTFEPFTDAFVDGSVIPTELPVPSDAAGSFGAGGFLSQVACSDASDCVAGGLYQSSDAGAQSLIESLSGGTWTANKVQLPSNAAANQTMNDSGIGGIACANARYCVVTAGYETVGGEPATLIDTLSHGNASTIEAPMPVNSVGYGGDVLPSISCPTSDSCVGVGTYSDGSNDFGLIEAERSS